MHVQKGGPGPVRPGPRSPLQSGDGVICGDRTSGPARGLHVRALLGVPAVALMVLTLAGCPQRKTEDAAATDAPKTAPTLSREERSTLFANLARLRLREKDWQRAIDYYRTSVDLSPDNPHWYLGLAEAYGQSGQTDLADEARTTAARLFKSEGLFVSAVALD